MRRPLRLLLLLAASAMITSPIFATTVTINTESAKAVLDALENPQITHEACLKIATLAGNQGMIRKTNEFKIHATNELFAEALFDAAHGVPVTDIEKSIYDFDVVKKKEPVLRRLIYDIESNPQDFQVPIEKRIALFTPTDTNLHLAGYVIAGGDGGGYAFGSTDFYLNIGRSDEFVIDKGVTTHELYHAVQGAFAKERGTVDDLPPPSGMPHTQQVCLKEGQLFANLYEEGSAVYVEDISLLDHAQSEIGLRKQADMKEGLQHVKTSAALLEMSVLSFEAPQSMSYDDVYDVGFYGHGILYNIGYVMAKAIAQQDGAQGLAAYLRRPPHEFVLGYAQMAAYGKDKDHPLLGPNTLAAARRVAAGCRP